MRTVTIDGQEVQNPNTDLGYLEAGKLLVEHHEAVEHQDAEYEETLQEEYDNGGKLYVRTLVSPEVPAQDAWDEYENVMFYIPYTEEELAEIEAKKQAAIEAQQQKEQERLEQERLEQERLEQEKADKIKAEQERAELLATQERQTKQVSALTSLSQMLFSVADFSSVSDAKVTSVLDLASEWNPNGVQYKKGTPFWFVPEGGDKTYYRCSQDTTSTEVYKPGDVGTESIYYSIKVAPDGILVWQEVKGEYNSIGIGERVHYPDENGAVFESTFDGNSYSPEQYPANWLLVTDTGETVDIPDTYFVVESETQLKTEEVM